MKRLVEEFFDDSSSEEEEEDDDFEMAVALITGEEEGKRRRGSQLGRRRIYRNRVEGHVKLVRDYFADDPVYPENLFRRRFQMHRDLFVRIVRAVEAHDIWFTMRRDAVGQISASPLQKCTAAMRVLAYGVSSDFVDEYIRIGEDLILESVKRFTQAMIEIFGEEYLRAPTDEDTARLMAMGEARGFPRMLGSIDCMHWTWKNCPAAWHGQFRGHCHDPTIILEAVASEDLWFWHSYFGMPGSHNELNVLQRSPLFARLAVGQAPPCNYVVNGHQYDMGYYLADGIYPPWATFVKTIARPEGNKKSHFAMCQEATRKDVERAFGVLQARFAIVRGPVEYWDQMVLWKIMTTCVILHNMITEDERVNR